MRKYCLKDECFAETFLRIFEWPVHCCGKACIQLCEIVNVK
jgi:hypothetical protein